MTGPLPDTIWDYWADRYEKLWAQHFSLTPSRELVHERLAEVAPEGARVLDAGCGVGQFLGESAERHPGWELVGFDPSRGMIDRARRDYPGPGIDYHA